MAYVPPPSPFKRPYPEEWSQSGDLANQGEWAPPRSAKEPRPPGEKEYDSRLENTRGEYPANPPTSVQSQGPPLSDGYPATPSIGGYSGWPPVEGYEPRPPPAEGYPPQPSAWDDYYSYYHQQTRPATAQGYPPGPPAAEHYQPRPTGEGYPQRPPAAEGYPPRPAAEGYLPRPGAEGYPPLLPVAEGYPPRPYYYDTYLPRPPVREDYPPRDPPRENYPPRSLPREDYPLRGPLREDYPPRGPPREDFPPRHPPREDYPLRPPPSRSDFPERAPWDAYAERNRTGNNDHYGKDGYGEYRKTDQRGNRSDVQRREEHDKNRGHMNLGRGRGDRGRGRGDERRGHFSQRRGEGRHIRGRGGMDSSPFKRRLDEEGDKRSSRKDYDEDKHHRGSGRGGRGGDRGLSRGRGAPRGSYSSRDPAGRGRGRYRGNDDEEEIDPEKMSLSEKIELVCSYVRSDKIGKENAISIIKNAIGHTKIGLECIFDSVEIGRLVTTTPMYTGTLKIGKVFLARGIRTSKKALKKEVFEKALNVLQTMSSSEIFGLMDPGEDAVKKQFEQQVKAETKKCEEELLSREKSREKNSGVEQDDEETHNIITRMINSILTMKNTPVSPVAVIEQAVSMSCGLMLHDFQSEVVKMSNGLLFFRGRLSIGSVVIGRGGEITKKKCKIETYKDALQRLKTLSVDELMESVSEKPIPEVRCIGESEENPTLSRMLALKLSLKHQRPKENNVLQLDVSALQKGLDPLVVFKQKEGQENSEQIICELYLGKILIHSCEGKVKHDCMLRVYKEAWEMLLKADIEDMVSNNRRITDEGIKDPKHLDVMIKGSEHSLESNVGHLRKFGYNISECEKLDIKDIVIVEHNAWSKDRETNAFTILQYSCNQNGMILQWESFTSGKYNRYIMLLQKQVLGDSYGPKRNFTRNLAAMDALFKLYETQDVLKVVPRPDDPQKWIPWSTFQDEADRLREQCSSELPPSSTDEQGNTLPDQFLMKVLKERLEKFNETKDKGEDELIIGPGILGGELKELKLFAKSIQLSCDSFQYQGEIYVLIYERISWKEMVELFKNGRSRPYGRFVLVDREELPTHKDIAVKIVKKILTGAEKPDTSKERDEPVENSDDELENVNDHELVKADKHDEADGPGKTIKTE